MRRISLIVALAVLLMSGIISGCSTTTSTVGAKIPAASLLDISKGSPTEDLIALLGEPISIAPYEGDPERVQIWTYELKKSQIDMISMETQEVPYVDPFTGELTSIEEPVYIPQTTTYTDNIQVFIVDEKVLGWKVEQDERRRAAD